MMLPTVKDQMIKSVTKKDEPKKLTPEGKIVTPQDEAKPITPDG